MTAYNFHKQFAPAIFRGDKTQTIRQVGKGRHAKRGSKLQLYFGMRTQHCRKIILHDPTCVSVEPLSIIVSCRNGWATIDQLKVGERFILPECIGPFAQSDGFTDANAMAEYFIQSRGVGFYDDYILIRWTTPKVPRRPRICPSGISCSCCDPFCLCGCRMVCHEYFERHWEFSGRRSSRLRLAKGGDV